MRYAAKSMMQRKTSFFRMQCPHDELTEAHRHEYVEIAYVVRGILRQNIIGQDEEFHAGEVCVIGQNSVHQDYLTFQDAQVIFIGISNDLFERKDMLGQRYNKAQDFFRKLVIQRKKDLKFIRFTPRMGATEEFETILGQIILENEYGKTGYTHILTGLLERLNDTLMTQFQISLSQKEQTKVRKLLFDDVVDYIGQNYATVTLEDLCRKFSYNPYYFNRLIRENTDLTYSQYLCHVRLDKAAFLLKTGTEPIEKIALMVGYTNQGFFYKKFQERFHVLPREYRMQ